VVAVFASPIAAFRDMPLKIKLAIYGCFVVVFRIHLKFFLPTTVRKPLPTQQFSCGKDLLMRTYHYFYNLSSGDQQYGDQQ